jgi:hypothetical protein
VGKGKIMEIINLSNNILNIVTFCNDNKLNFWLEKEIESNDTFITIYINNNTQEIGVIATPQKNTYVLTSYVLLKNSYPFIEMGTENLTTEQIKEIILTELKIN